MNAADALWAFVVACAVALALTPFVARLAVRLGAVDRPRERGLNERETPSLGGIAIFAGVFVAGLAFMPDSTATRGILAGAAAITIVGALDDLFDLPPALKLLGQIGAALIPVLSDVKVETFTLPFVGFVDLGEFGGRRSP